jgi:hypothetical protein
MPNEEDTVVKLGPLSHHNAPILLLPNEVLVLIFGWGQQICDSSNFSFPYSHFESDADSVAADSEPESLPSFEVIISHVTSHWRHVAVNASCLWNKIYVSSRSSLDKLRTYLERSQTCPLHLRVVLHENIITNLALLTPHVNRWRTFSTISNNGARNDAVWAYLHDLAAPELVHVSIHINASKHLELMPNIVDNPFPQIFTGGAPALSFVRLGCHAMSFFRPPLTSITTLHLDQTAHLSMSYAQFCRIITSSPALTNLSIYGDMIGMQPWPLTANSLDMPALRSLRICGIGGHVYSGLLLNISAPGLESLVLKDVQHHDLDRLWDFPQVPKFPALHSLTFCDFECTESMYRKFFHAFPAITHFTSLNSSLYTPRALKLIGGLGMEVGARLPWPRLHTLTMLFDFDDEASLVTMVTTRIHLEHPIAKLRLGMAGERNKPRAVRLAQWLRERLHVEGFSGVDPWPGGLQYVDEDDVMF